MPRQNSVRPAYLDASCGHDRRASPGCKRPSAAVRVCRPATAFAVKLRANQPALADCLDAIAAALQDEFPGIGDNVAIDASDMPAYANGQRYVRQGGPERERFSDPDATWGHRSAVSTRSRGGFYGYKLQLLACTRTGLPLAWQVATARQNESLFVAPLLDMAHRRGFCIQTVAMDKAYDIDRVHAECETRGAAPVVPLRGYKGKLTHLPVGPICRLNPRIPRHSEEFSALYAGRSAVEREFGRLKHDYGLAALRVRGFERVQLHADLTILARLALALARTRELALAA